MHPAADPKITQWITAELAKGNTPEVLYAALVQKGWNLDALRPYLVTLFGSEDKARNILKNYGIELEKSVELTGHSISLLTLTGFDVSQPAPQPENQPIVLEVGSLAESAAGSGPQGQAPPGQSQLQPQAQNQIQGQALGQPAMPGQSPQPQVLSQAQAIALTQAQAQPQGQPPAGAPPAFSGPQLVTLEGQTAAKAARVAQAAQSPAPRRLVKKKVEKDFVYIDDAGNSVIKKEAEQEVMMAGPANPALKLRGNLQDAQAKKAEEENQGMVSPRTFMLASRFLWCSLVAYQGYILFLRYMGGR